MSTPSIEKMEQELLAGGWKLVSVHDSRNWLAPNGNTYSGVEYCWLIFKGDEFSKNQRAWGTKKNLR